MSELGQVLQQLETISERQRQDVAAIYAEMKADRNAADARREVDRALFMTEIKNIFANGCAKAERHDRTAVLLEKQILEMERVRSLFDKGMGAIWAVGALVSVIGLISGWIGSFLQAGKGHP